MKITAKAHPNIALIKYFGKKDKEAVLPFNDSLSITWDTFETITSIRNAETFSFHLNGKVASKEDHDKIRTFLCFFTNKPLNVSVVSHNNFPTAAGLASSASAFAALSVAANSFFACDYDQKTLEVITRKGSGSAIRSLYGGINIFGRDGHVQNIKADISDYRLLVVVVDGDKKAMSSRLAMQHVVETSPLYQGFVDTANKAIDPLVRALKSRDFKTVGKISEKSALSMHAAMLASNPWVHYLNDDSFKVLKSIEALKSNGYNAYFTMDAGPNIKILTTSSDVSDVRDFLIKRNHRVLGPLKPSMEGATIL